MSLADFVAGAARDFAELGFLRRALLAGLIVGTTCSVLSVYVVLRRLAFVGHGISHAAFGGVALGLLLFQGSPNAELGVAACTLAFALAVAMLVAAASRGRRVSEDTAIGIFFSAAMALGVIFIALREQYASEVLAYLFGSILAVTPTDLKVIAALGALVLGAALAVRKEMYFFVFDEESAEAAGMPVRLLHYGMLALIALTVVASIKVVGIVLVSAYLVIPGATALALATTLWGMVALSAAAGVLSSVLGLALSNAFDVPSGATIVLTQFALFGLSTLLRRRA